MALRDIVRRTFEQGSGPAVVPNMILDRLLDERAMLLDALREITFDNRPGGGAYDRACRAIEKADAS